MMSSKKFEIHVSEVISYHGIVVADSKEQAVQMVLASWAAKQLNEADHDLTVNALERANDGLVPYGGNR